jgi:hypothetical protein
MHDADPYGHLLVDGRQPTVVQIGRLVGETTETVAELLDELETARVFSRTDDGIIYSRRLVQDRREYLDARDNGRKGGNPSLLGRNLTGPPANPEHIETGQPPEPTIQATKKRRQTAPDLFAPAGSDQPKTPTAKDLLFTDGLRIVRKLTGRADKACSSLIGSFRKHANGDDATLLRVLQAAENKPPDHFEAWVVGCLKGAPTLVVNNVPEDPDDLWGIGAFCRKTDGIAAADGDAKSRGEWVLDGKWMFDVSAKKVATAARFPGARAVDWGLLVDWLRAGLKMDQHIFPTIMRLAASFETPATNLRIFDRIVREQRAA